MGLLDDFAEWQKRERSAWDASRSVMPEVRRQGSKEALDAWGGVAGLLGSLTKFQKAHQLAQKNAALPVEQGGLGLPPDNTAAQRSKALGFDRDVYHATPNDFSEFQYNNWRGGSFVAEDPVKTLVGSRAGSGEMQFAKADPTHILPLKMSGKVFGIDDFPEWFLPREVTYGQFRNELVKGKHGPHPLKGLTPDQEEALNSMRTAEAKQRYVEAVPESEWGKYAEDALPLRLGPKQEKRIGYGDFEGVGTNSWIPGSTLKRENFRDLLRRLGFDSAAIADEAGKSYAVMDTSKLRSRFAAFDPMKRNSRDLLASLGLVGLLGSGMYGNDQ